MSMVRMFTIQCDSCNYMFDSSEWYASIAIETAKEEGFHIQGNIAICEECWDNGTRYHTIKQLQGEFLTKQINTTEH